MKKWLSVVLFILLLAIVGLSLVLLPAHRQIRSVNTPLPPLAEFTPLRRADGPVNIRYISTAQTQLPESTLTHSAFVFEWADGTLFLVDAGMREATALEFGEMLKLAMGAGETRTHGTIAELMGKSVARIAGVGFTHLHLDHTEGVTTLCENTGLSATLLQTAFQQTEHNFNTSESAQLLRESCLSAVVPSGGTILEHPGFPGLGMVAVGGHTPGSTLFTAWLDDTLYLFSGDITNSKQALVEDLGKGWAYSNLFVPEDTDRTSQLRAWLRDLSAQGSATVVVSHDLGDIEGSGLSPFEP